MYKTYMMSIIRYIEETSSLYPHDYQTNGSSLIFFGTDHVTNVQSKVTCRNDVQVRLCTCWGAPSAKGRQGADPGRDLGAAKAGRQDLSDQETRSAGRWRQGGGLRASQGVAVASRRRGDGDLFAPLRAHGTPPWPCVFSRFTTKDI